VKLPAIGPFPVARHRAGPGTQDEGQSRAVRLATRIPDFAYYKDQVNCLSRCPVHTDARGYIQAIERDDYETAYLIARAPNPLASICGRICGSPCELACRRGAIDAPVSIRALKRVVTEALAFRSDIRPGLEPDRRRERLIERFSRHRSGSITDVAALAERARKDGARPRSVGIIGSGPAGLACAHDLAVLGHRPVIYEMERVPAGMLFLGVPAYRLPRDVILAEIELIKMMGVEILTGVCVGKDVTMRELCARHDAVVIAVGAKQSRTLPIPGAQASGVMGAVEFLRAVALGEDTRIGQDIVVIGGGNVAYDVSRTAVRNTEEDAARSAVRQPYVRSVTLCCLEALHEMPADVIEIRDGEEEGVIRHNRLGPKEILTADGRVRGVVFQRVLSVFDDKGRFAPVFDPDDTVEFAADTVIMSVGQRTDLSFLGPQDGVAIDKKGLAILDDQGRTTRQNVYVAGDATRGPALMIDAIASGKRVALAIHGDAMGVELAAQPRFHFKAIPDYRRSRDYDALGRTPVPQIPSGRRLTGVHELVEIGYHRTLAARESQRCLDCAVSPVFNSDRCILCAGCVDVCPLDCLLIVPVAGLATTDALASLLRARYGADDGAGAAILKDETACIRCGLCAIRCPVGAITMERLVFEEVIR
jgi:NADPH-dependent glutamate synthase beta subunit-like oxidoreductase/NAD-dependent dihydropyrimidine dehydrogenase PreA subunit